MLNDKFHPFQIKRYLYNYIVIATILVLLPCIMLYIDNDCFSIKIIYSVIHIATLFFFGSGIWFVIKYMPDHTNIFQIIASHFVSCSIMVLSSMFVDEIFGSLIFTITEKQSEGLPTIAYFSSGVFIYIIAALYFYLLNATIDNQEKKENEKILKSLLRESELTSLKSQINPHFLFNSLNSISSLTIYDAMRAQEMLIKLSDYLRYSLKQNDNNLVALQEELSNCKRYLEIEKIRFGEKLITEFDINENCLEQTLPVLLLQPLYENAVKHGVYESLQPISIKTKVYFEEDNLVIKISNDFDPEAKPRKGEGIGLENVRKRLQLTYNNEAEMIIDKKNQEFNVCLYIPKNQLEA